MKKRIIYDKILAQRDTKKASIIIGPRQVGKTTILKELYQNLGGLFFDVDVFTDYDRVSTYEKLLATLKVNGYRENQGNTFFVFLDEFQRYSDLSRVIKSVYDHHDNIKIYATGSSSLEIKSSILESLAGRKIITPIYPLDFEEFLYFKEREDLIRQIRRLNGLESDDYFSLVPGARALLDEFLIFGGYPEVVLDLTPEAKQDALRSIFDLYIKKDIVEYARAEKLRNASQLMRLLAANNGQPANYAKYAVASELNMETVKKRVDVPAIKYYRSKTGEEGDIILDRTNKPLLPIEIKLKKSIGARDVSSVNRFVRKHSLPKGRVVTVGQLKILEELELVDCFRGVED